MSRIMEALQALGRALMLPIAVLPVAALLLRLGQPDLLDLAFVSAAGNAMFAHLGLLFAIGVATGFARDNDGAAALAGIVCYLVATEGAGTLLAVPPNVAAGVPDVARAGVEAAWRTAQIDRLGVPMGIVSGIVGGMGYNRFAGIRLPEYLSFFGGRRFVPIVAGLAGVILAGLVGASFGAIDRMVSSGTSLALASGEWGLFVYGVANRLLLVTGLHHILNNIAWFVIGDYQGATGDLRRFFAGDPAAGGFMSGFFPVMMFGLPAACLAMYHTARPERRKAVGGMLLSLAATSFLTGVTEPIEYSFMFLAPALFVLHSVLTGVSMALMNALGVHLGFGFSAGLFDFVLNYGQATRPLLLLPVGLAYALVYYTTFRLAIRWLDLRTPGRDEVDMVADPLATPASDGADRGAAFLAALGGGANLAQVDACTTRLRLVVQDQALVREADLRALGAKGIVRPSARSLQVVLGPQADQVAQDIRRASAMAGQALSTRLAEAARQQSSGIPKAVLSSIGASNDTVIVVDGRIIIPSDCPVDLAALWANGLIAEKTIGPSRHLLFQRGSFAGGPET